MKNVLLILFSLLLFLTFVSCNDPVFYTISQEIEPIEPLIKGSPTNFAVFNDYMYVASGERIYGYKEGEWPSDKQKGTGGTVMMLAATSVNLYALLDSGSVIFYNGDLTETGRIPVGNIQTVFGVNDKLFFSVRSGEYYSVYYCETDNVPVQIAISSITCLNGVVYDGSRYYYLSTDPKNIYDPDYAQEGVFFIDNALMNTATHIENSPVFTGIINLGNSAAAGITRKGELCIIKNLMISGALASMENDRMSSSALALWRRVPDDPDNLYDDFSNLLLIGRQERFTYSTDSGHTYGYLEMGIDTATGDISVGASLHEPGILPISTVDNYERYLSSIGKKPVNHIFQVPYNVDTGMRLFASTQKDGVWSYRLRKDGYGWNAED